MGWTEDAWRNEPVELLMKQYNGYRADRKELWEIGRVQAFYTVVAFNGTTKFKKPSDLFPIPGEKVKPVKQATLRRMTDDEIRERYLNAGYTEAQVERIVRDAREK